MLVALITAAIFGFVAETKTDGDRIYIPKHNSDATWSIPAHQRD